VIYYPTYANGKTSPLTASGLVAALDANTMADKFFSEQIALAYWPKAVTIANGKLWVAWQSIEKGTLNRYNL